MRIKTLTTTLPGTSLLEYKHFALPQVATPVTFRVFNAWVFPNCTHSSTASQFHPEMCGWPLPPPLLGYLWVVTPTPKQVILSWAHWLFSGVFSGLFGGLFSGVFGRLLKPSPHYLHFLLLTPLTSLSFCCQLLPCQEVPAPLPPPPHREQHQCRRPWQGPLPHTPPSAPQNGLTSAHLLGDPGW